jgi:hypothetical protein
MRKKTVAQLTHEIEELRKQAGNVHISGHLVWNAEQIKDVIEKMDTDGSAFKIEITHGFEPGKRCYNIYVWHYPPITRT